MDLDLRSLDGDACEVDGVEEERRDEAARKAPGGNLRAATALTRAILWFLSNELKLLYCL